MSVKLYRFWAFDDAVATGLVDASDLQNAVNSGEIRVTTDGDGKEWLNGREIQDALGVNLPYV